MPEYHEVREAVIPDVPYHQHIYSQELNCRLRSDDRWLDIGAGSQIHSGWKEPSALSLTERAQWVLGCDLRPEQLKDNEHIDLKLACDATDLPLDDRSVDFVTANMVLEHLRQPRAVFEEIRRILRPTGIFVFVTPNRAHPAVWAISTFLPTTTRRWIARWSEHETRSEGEVFDTAYQANTVGKLKDLASAVGFSVLRLDPFFSFPMIQNFWLGTWGEAHLIRLARAVGLNRWGSNIIGSMQKQDER